MTNDYISVTDFAKLAGISRQSAAEILKKCFNGKSWRGAFLLVRLAHGRGGRSGVQYQVAAKSLPVDLVHPHTEYGEEGLGLSVSSANPEISFPAAMNEADWEWRHSVIRPALAHPRGSRARAEIVTEIARTAVHASGKRRGKAVSERTLYAWIAEYETGGFGKLARKGRADRGQRRVIVSAKWDALADASGIEPAERESIATAVRRHVASQWRSGCPSWPTVQLNTLPFLMALTRKAGYDAPDDELRPACMLPRAFIEDGRRFKAVALRRKDAGRSAAIQTPRIHRDRSHLQPMEWVAGDVHHIDILFRRDDGTLCTPKAVAWMDLATNRAFVSLFLMPKGQMIRREHVIQSFVDMCCDPNWGVPTRLYIDNGGEYNWTDFVNDLSRLKRAVEIYDAKDLGSEAGARRSRPYNPQSKVIETLFAVLERTSLSQLPGHIGGDRMKKKTENQGKEPIPYPGDFDKFTASFNTALNYYHVKAQSGHLAGRSPLDRFKGFVATGWRSLLLDPAELAVAFAKEEARKVYAGGEFSFGGRVYRHDALLALAGCGSVIVRAPLFGDRERLFVFSEEEAFLCVAEPPPVFAFGDIKGAGEQQRMNAALNRQIRAMEAETDSIDLERSIADAAAAHGPMPVATPIGVASVRPEFRSAARGAKALPDRSADTGPDPVEVRRRLAQRLAG